MKQKITLILLFLLTTMSCGSINNNATLSSSLNSVSSSLIVYTSQNDFEFDILHGEATITKYIGNSYEVVIPPTINMEGFTYNVTSIGEGAFKNCSSLISIVVPDRVTYIGGSAFYNCSSLTSIVIPDRVTSIKEYAFYNCSSLTSIVIPDRVTSIKEYAFYNCSSLTSIVIPDRLTSIKEYAFYGCSSLTSIVIPDSVTSIGDYAFVGCSSLTIYCEAESKPSGWASSWNYSNRPVYWGVASEDIIEQNGIQYLIINGEAVVTRYVGNDAQLVIPSTINMEGFTYNVTSIEKYAFEDCSSLISIVIPDSVTYIGNYAFSGSRSLTSIIIPDSVTSIGSGAFYVCNSLTSITLPFVGEKADESGKTHFGYIFGASSYSDNDDYVPTSLKKVIITGGNSINSYAFYNCISLTSIVIPDSVTYIGNYVFSGSSSLTSIIIPDSVTYIGGSAFKNCSCLTSIVIPDRVTSIKEYAFYGCISLTSIVIPDRVTSISQYAFYNCDSLISIVIPDRLTSIDNYAFKNCSCLTSIVIPDSVTYIGSYAFSGCSFLTIYCEASSKPSGWSSSWNSSNRPVIWGYTGE